MTYARLAAVRRLLLILPLWLISPALAHDRWADATPVPSWVKASCCGAADAHHLRPEQVHDVGDYYRVDGYDGKIPHRQALPSQDGEYWVFYRDSPAHSSCSPYSSGGHCAEVPASQSSVYCFFIPMAF
jgi:hypothetical protein